MSEAPDREAAIIYELRHLKDRIAALKPYVDEYTKAIISRLELQDELLKIQAARTPVQKVVYKAPKPKTKQEGVAKLVDAVGKDVLLALLAKLESK